MKTISLGLMIRSRRKELGLTIEELADKVDIDRTYITKIEKHNFLPAPKVLIAIITNLKDKPDRYMRLYKSLKLERAMKTWKQKIKILPDKF